MSRESAPNFESQEGELYDFYFSSKQLKHFNEMEKVSHEISEAPPHLGSHTIHGNLYTEMVKKGEKPTGNFDDYKLVYSAGKMEDIHKI